MNPRPTLSVVIPTYKRSDYLKECLDSCVNQSVLPTEIIIGDDSPDDTTEKFIKSYQAPLGVNIRYFHHKPSKGQALNVAAILAEAHCEMVTLIHDDDFFYPGAFELLLAPFEDPEVIATFGKHMVCNDKDNKDPKESEEIAKRFFKTQQDEGLIGSTLISAYSGQFPNNSFILRNTPNLSSLYKQAAKYNNACDIIFSCFYALSTQGSFYFVNQYTCAYRLSEESICRGGHIDDSVVYGYWGTYNLKGLNYSDPKVIPNRDARSLGASSCLLRQRKYWQAARIIFGRHLGWRLFFTKTGWRWIYRQLWPAFVNGIKK